MSEFISKGREKEKNEWKSPRAIRELGKLVIRQAFECEMQEADERLITREEALQHMQALADVMSDPDFYLKPDLRED